jgi:hypothetical protein
MSPTATPDPPDRIPTLVTAPPEVEVLTTGVTVACVASEYVPPVIAIVLDDATLTIAP